MTVSMVRILGLLGAALLLASCSGPLFSKVEVKASPTVYAALGNAKAQVADYVSIGKIRDLLKSSSDTKVYDYQDPADTTQKFLISYPLTAVELDFGAYMKDLKLDSTLSQALTPGSFSIPDLNQTKNQTGSFDLNATLRTNVNGGFSAKQSPFAETGSPSSISATLPDVTISITQFKTATFASGSLNLQLAMPTASAGLVLDSTIALVDGNTNTVLVSTAAPVNVKSGTATLNLAGVTLTDNLKVRFTATTSGGTTLKSSPVDVTPSLSGGATISAATGINLSTSITTPNVTLPVNSGGKLVSAEVETGKIEISLAALPAGWTGFTRSTSITLKQSAATLASGSGNDAGGASKINIDLATKTLTNQDISVEASSSITATNASFSGLSGTPVSVGVDAVVTIDKFKTIRVKPGVDFKPQQVFTETMSQQLIDWVDTINFTEVGIQFDINNALPSGNDMTISLVSDAFGITTGTNPAVNLPSGQAPGVTTPAKFTRAMALKPVNIGDKSTPSDGKPDLDFTVTLQPTGYNAGTGEMDLNNIVPGTTLSVGGNVKLIADWSTADIKPKTGGVKGTFPSDGSKTDLGQLKTYLGTDINFGTIPAYLYISGLDPATVKMDAQVLAKYNAGTVKALAGTLSGTEPLSMLASAPTFPAGDTITTAWPTTASKAFTVDDILNAKPNDLQFTYELNLSSLTVTNDPNQPSQKISTNLVLILPLELRASATAPANAVKLGVDNPLPKDDLFGRKVGANNDSINKLLENLVSMKLSLAIVNKTGLQLRADLVKDTIFSKTLQLPANTGTVDLELTSADIDTIIKTIPFDLAMTVNLPASPSPGTTYSIQRGGSISATITVNAVTDIDQTFNLRGTN